MQNTFPIRWQPKRAPAGTLPPLPSMPVALRRGAFGRCPACGKGRLFATWLGVRAQCDNCAAPLGLIPADDAPPYFTVFIVAHVAIGAQLALERSVALSITTELLIFLPATLALVLALIRPVKGATVGLMMKLGFMKPPEPAGDD